MITQPSRALLFVALVALPHAAHAACAPAAQRQLEALEARCASERSGPLHRACTLALDRMRRCQAPGLGLDSGESQLTRFAVEDPANPTLRYVLVFDPPAHRDGDPVTVRELRTWSDTSRSVTPAQRRHLRRLLARHCRKDRDAWLRSACRAFDRTLARWPRWTTVALRSDAIEVRIPEPPPGSHPHFADRTCAVTFLPASRPTEVGDLYCCLECF